MDKHLAKKLNVVINSETWPFLKEYLENELERAYNKFDSAIEPKEFYSVQAEIRVLKKILNFKESIRKRDNYKCQNPDCWENTNSETLNIHHVNYVKKNCHPKNLISLCRSCNARANHNRKYWQKLYTKILEGKK